MNHMNLLIVRYVVGHIFMVYFFVLPFVGKVALFRVCFWGLIECFGFSVNFSNMQDYLVLLKPLYGCFKEAILVGIITVPQKSLILYAFPLQN
jgi:hypothetical protein